MKIKSMWLWAPLLLASIAGARAQETSAVQPDAYHAALMRELADKWKMPSGTPLLPQSESVNAQAFEVFGPAASNATKSIIAVEGQPFKTAIRIDIAKPGALWWHVLGRVSNVGAIRAGDSVLASFWVRGQVPNMGGSEAELDAGLKDIPDPQQEYTTLHLSANPNWQRVFLPMTASKDRATGEIQFIFVLGPKKQQIDLAGFSLIDFGPDVRVEQLPRPEPQRFTYPNRGLDAPWRKAALKRIDRIRKGDLTIRVRDAKGRAIPDAQVRVAMTRKAFMPCAVSWAIIR